MLKTKVQNGSDFRNTKGERIVAVSKVESAEPSGQGGDHGHPIGIRLIPKLSPKQDEQRATERTSLRVRPVGSPHPNRDKSGTILAERPKRTGGNLKCQNAGEQVVRE